MLEPENRCRWRFEFVAGHGLLGVIWMRSGDVNPSSRTLG